MFCRLGRFLFLEKFGFMELMLIIDKFNNWWNFFRCIVGWVFFCVDIMLLVKVCSGMNDGKFVCNKGLELSFCVSYIMKYWYIVSLEVYFFYRIV